MLIVAHSQYNFDTCYLLQRQTDGTLFAGGSTGSFSTEGGFVYMTAHTAEGAFTIERKLWMTMNGEPEAISSSGEFRSVVGKSFNVVGRSTGPTVDYRLYARTRTACMKRVGRHGVL
jgi:hypothetical protein